jgi:hypothetical protein
MPVTPLHYFLAYIIHRASKFKLNFPALIVGSMVPDLEVPIIFITSRGEIDRLVLHSILGSMTLGLLISIFISLLIYPRILGFLNCRKELKCIISKSLIISSLIGVLSHVLLDALPFFHKLDRYFRSFWRLYIGIKNNKYYFYNSWIDDLI